MAAVVDGFPILCHLKGVIGRCSFHPHALPVFAFADLHHDSIEAFEVGEALGREQLV